MDAKSLGALVIIAGVAIVGMGVTIAAGLLSWFANACPAIYASRVPMCAFALRFDAADLPPS
jgi:hypothetical protein